MKGLVVDRARLDFSNEINGLMRSNRQNAPTHFCGVREPLANLLEAGK